MTVMGGIKPRVRVLGYREEQVLAFVLRYFAEYGRAPVFRTIRDELGFLTVADVSKVVCRLERRGLLIRKRAKRVRRSTWRQPVLRLPAS